MEHVYRRMEQLIDKSQSNIFTKIVIAASFVLILIIDITMFALVGDNSDNNRLSIGYYTFFFIFQFWWSYSSWMMLFILLYIRREELPDSLRYWRDPDNYPMDTFLKFLGSLFMWGKFSFYLTVNNRSIWEAKRKDELRQWWSIIKTNCNTLMLFLCFLLMNYCCPSNCVICFNILCPIYDAECH